MEAFLQSLLNTAKRVASIVTDLQNRTHWGFLLCTLVLAMGLLAWSQAARIGLSKEGRRAELQTILPTLFDRSIWLHDSAIVDYWCYIINAIVAGALKLAGAIASALTSILLYQLLLRVAGEPLSLTAGPVALAIYTPISLLWFDLAVYVSHFLSHRVQFLWEFHKVHHSAQVLTPVTFYRVHPLDFIFNDLLSGVFAGVAGACGLFVFGGQIEPVTILGVNAGLFLLYALGANLRHSHVWFAYPAWLSRILISPAQHQIHHSSLPQHHDANFGVHFALWDWMFGTLYVPKEREKIAFGLHEGEDREYQSVENLYLLPFKKIWRRWFPRGELRPEEQNALP
jgi:sterol desaturase/sphingolipid hydroxylase (fatty acid hydroxylase superfamily)